jgi:hypothetical protein
MMPAPDPVKKTQPASRCQAMLRLQHREELKDFSRLTRVVALVGLREKIARAEASVYLQVGLPTSNPQIKRSPQTLRSQSTRATVVSSECVDGKKNYSDTTGAT